MTYDCDTKPYWTNTEKEDHSRIWGEFIEKGAAYRIHDPDTPRPWLNYLCNDTFGAVISNRGEGFQWLYSTLFRITKYDHPIDYLPREFDTGRDIWLSETGASPVHFFKESEDFTCVHSPISSVFTGKIRNWHLECEFFVPLEHPMELMRITLSNNSQTPRKLNLAFEQTWSMAAFGIHTAEEGIPYLTTPGTRFTTRRAQNGWRAYCDDPELPCAVHAFFESPGANPSELRVAESQRPDGRTFRFHVARLQHDIEVAPGETRTRWIASGAAPDSRTAETCLRRLHATKGAEGLLSHRKRGIRKLQKNTQCTLNKQDKDIEYFLNTWFKHQLHLTFHNCRSGHSGYRDTLQDLWGYTLIDAFAARRKLLEVLSHLRSDGTAPRNYSKYGDAKHDHRRYMDSGTWIAEALTDYVAESGDISVLQEPIPYLDGGSGTVLEHVWRAGQALFKLRGQNGVCLVGDGDWNDALEGISRDGDAVSMWLTMALYHSHRRLAELMEYIQDEQHLSVLRSQMQELRAVINNAGWDGEWFVYGFTGSGRPIGSHRNREGRIHANAQSWAVFSGAATPEHASKAMDALDHHLQTPLGTTLLAPPYVEDAAEVGRIARLEPGTFENGSIYIHAVAFQVRAYLALGQNDKAYQTLKGVLPTNPANPAARRTSEPYATGNYYCGPHHARFGQNFFTWFTGNPAWFLRIGFDELLGVRAGFKGLIINPHPPAHWKSYRVQRTFQGCRYDIRFHHKPGQPLRIEVDDKSISGSVLPILSSPSAKVLVQYP